MDNYLEKFKNLPRELQEAVTSEGKVKTLEEIEKKYNLKLAKLVVRVMIKDILWSDLEKFCQENFKLTSKKATELKKELAEKIFNEVIEYLTKESRVEELRVKEEEKTEERLIETTPLVAKQIVAPLNLEEVVKEIKEKTGLTLEDEILEKRFKNVVKSYLKDVRDEVELEETLSRPKKIGGLELSSESTTKIIKIVKEYKGKFIETDRNIQPSTVKLIEIKEPEKELKVEELNVKSEEKKEPEIRVNEPISAKATMDLQEFKKKFEAGTITPVFKELEKPLDESQIKSEELEVEKVEKELVETKEVPIQIRRPIRGEELVEDISIKPKAIGPVEELAEITLIDLKRWGGGETTSQIILDKISLLQEESLFKKAEGIRAWQKSPLYKLYLEIGQEALEKRKSISEVIDQRKLENRPFFEVSDFEAIVELNKKLRF